MKIQRIFKFFIVAGVITGGMLACQVESLISAPSTPQISNLLFFDDFNNPDSGWDQYSNEVVREYYQGTYHINIPLRNYITWSAAHQSFGDVWVRVELANTGSADITEMGLICRMVDGENFYFLTIRSDGYYAVQRMEDGVESYIGMDGYQFSEAVNPGITTNQIEARCIGDRLSLSVNGQQVIVVNDSSFQVGDVGILAGTFEQGNADIFYDNFEVHRP